MYDFIAVDAGLHASADVASLPLASAGAPLENASASAKKATPATGTAGKALEYEVRPGDTLSDISQAVFGTATRWKEILEANRDKLQKPESLQAGMKLRIPEGGKLPVQAAKPEAKKAEPKTAHAAGKPAPTAPTTPKKKVD
jgi:Tfp pilus assembly protein FimV